MASKDILPAVIRYSRSLAETINTMRAAGAEPYVASGLLKQIT